MGGMRMKGRAHRNLEPHMHRRIAALVPLLIAGLSGCSKSTSPSPPPAQPAQWSRGAAGLPGGGFRNASLAASGTTLLAGLDGPGVYRSTDGGVTWSVAATQPTNTRVFALAGSGSTLLAGTLGAGV